ncbi:CHAD domain-containing protein [Merismopedia glauca]|uniref:Metal-binding protein n=1 Tax=Merismopedia glauca CCAP 1448/3 TaxID=1296344 RepID=A0A2T1C6N3_9CYAN|nr:CHAD domain-containing protein [Merismopedia glauca]PSB03909.1 metal-binding protein [Merismopedia glauca CCAP 1448/3]
MSEDRRIIDVTESADKLELKKVQDWGYLAIKKHFSKILKNEDNVIKDRDPESLHQMRVGMRRLRSAAIGFAVGLKLPRDAQPQKVGKVARILGKLRDIDVLQASLNSKYKDILPDEEQKLFQQVLDELRSQRKAALKEVRSALKGKEYKKIKQAYQQWLEEPKYTQLGSVNILEILPDLLLPIISELLLHPAWWIQGENISNSQDVADLLAQKGETIHDLRKQIKRSRYQMELFTDLYSDNYQNYVTDLKEIQDILGEIQDCFVLDEFLETVLDIDSHQQMPTLLAQLQENRGQLWQDWAQYQQKYLNPETRKALHLELLSPKL